MTRKPCRICSRSLVQDSLIKPNFYKWAPNTQTGCPSWLYWREGIGVALGKQTAILIVSYIRFKTFRTKGLSLQQLILVLVGNAFDHRWTLYIGHWTLYILSLPFSSNLPAASFLISRMWNCLARNTQRTGWVWNGLTFQSIKQLFVQAICSTLHSSGCLRIEEHQWQGAQQQHMVASLIYVVRFSLELVVAFMGVKGLGFTCQAWMWSSPIMHLKCSSTFVRTIHWLQLQIFSDDMIECSGLIECSRFRL